MKYGEIDPSYPEALKFYIKEFIDMMEKRKNGIHVDAYDCYYYDLECEINYSENNKWISAEVAHELRAIYLGNGSWDW